MEQYDTTKYPPPHETVTTAQCPPSVEQSMYNTAVAQYHPVAIYPPPAVPPVSGIGCPRCGSTNLA